MYVVALRLTAALRGNNMHKIFKWCDGQTATLGCGSTTWTQHQIKTIVAKMFHCCLIKKHWKAGKWNCTCATTTNVSTGCTRSSFNILSSPVKKMFNIANVACCSVVWFLWGILGLEKSQWQVSLSDRSLLWRPNLLLVGSLLPS